MFDTDGVLTDTASVHAAAWKRLFDEYLRRRAAAHHEPFRAFRGGLPGPCRRPGPLGRCRRLPRLPGHHPALGRPRRPAGPRDGLRAGQRQGPLVPRPPPRPWRSRLPQLGRVRAPAAGQGLPTAVVSASRNMVAVLESAGLGGLFDVEVDRVEADRLGLAGKPDPALFLEAARRLQVAPAQAAVVEDALAGVEAGRRGRFQVVVGVDRGGQATAWPSAAPTWSSPTWESSPLNPPRRGKIPGERLDAGLRRLRPPGRAAPGGAVHPRQRLLRHPRSRARGGRRRRPLPRDLCRRGLRSPARSRRRP